MALIPLVMAATILFPADADAPSREETPAVMIPAPGPAGADYEVTIDTGMVVVLSGSVISAKTVTATSTTAPEVVEPTDPTE